MKRRIPHRMSQSARTALYIYVREFFIQSFASLKQDLSRRSIVMFMTHLSRIAPRNIPDVGFYEI